MNRTLEIQKAMLSSDAQDVTLLLEALDNESRILARTYLSALADRAQMERKKQVEVIA
ncbi:MAG: hypothetical protein K2H85_08850 [Allobaculum sp.]|nr:hypothetical protein [Allobaculum sp.]